MIKNDNILDELFRSKLSTFEKAPPSYVWERIQENQKANKQKRIMIILRVSGIAAAIVLAFILGWQMPQSQRQLSKRLAITGKDTLKNQVPAIQEIEPLGESSKKESHQAVQHQSATGGPSLILQEKAMPPGNDYASFAFISDSQATNKETEKAGLPGKTPVSGETYAFLSMIQPSEVSHPAQIYELAIKKKKSDPKRFGDLTEREIAMVEMNSRLFSQGKSRKPDKNWRVGASVTPAYSVYQTSYSETYASNMAGEGDKQAMQFGGGVSVSHKTGKRLSVQSGLYYSQLSQTTGGQANPETARVDILAYSNSKVQIVEGNMLMNGAAGVIEINNLPRNIAVGSSLETANDYTTETYSLMSNPDFEQRMAYLEVPLNVNYQLVDKAVNVHLLGGFSANVLVGNDVYMQDGTGENRVGKTKDMSELSYSIKTGFGIGYSLTQRLQLLVEPQLKYYLNSLSTNPDIQFKPYTIGIYTGINYRF